MVILVISQYFWPENFIINDLTDALCKRGQKIIVLTGQPNYPEGVVYPGYKWWRITRTVQENGVTVFRIPQWPRGKKSALGLGLNYLSYVLFASILGPILLFHQKIDSIFVFAVSPITQAIPAILIGRIKKAKIAIWVQDLWPDSLSATGYVKNSTILRYVHKLVKWIYNSVDLLLGQSQGFVRALRAEECKSEIGYFPNAVPNFQVSEISSFAENGRLVELIKVMRNQFSVVFAGNIGEAQSVETVVDAAKILKLEEPKIGIFVVGSGSKLDFLLSAKAQFQLDNLHLPGRFSSSEINFVLNSADALLLTLADSPTFELTIPLRTQTYLSTGRPIVAAANGEAARVIAAAGAGLCGPAEDSKMLVRNILAVFKMSAEDRNEMGQRGKKYFLENFELNRQVDRLIRFLTQ